METKSPYHLFGDIRKGNYMRVAPLSGILSLKGNARVYKGEIPPLAALAQTATGKPDIDTANCGFAFPQNDAAEILSGSYCLNSDYAEGTALYPRILWIQSGATAPAWKLDYRWINLGGQVGDFTTLTIASHEFTYIQGTILQLSNFTGITGTGYRAGSILQVKLYRDDNVVAGDVTAVSFGIYKRLSSLGSETPLLKQAQGTLISSSPSSSISASPSASPSAS